MPEEIMVENNHIDPLSILMVTSGTRGDRLLFKYPTQACISGETTQAKNPRLRNPYAVKISEDYSCKTLNTNTEDGDPLDSARFTDQILANLLAVKSELLCSKKFNIKVDSVRFIGFPMVFEPCTSKQTSSGKTSHQIISVNIVLALKANIGQSVVSCYHDLMKQLTVAVHYEEKRRQYLSHEAKIMLAVHDEVAALPEDSTESPFGVILERSSLARDLQSVFESLCMNGVVQLLINKWITISFCLPHRVHKLPWIAGDNPIEPEEIQKCLESLRPYHGILLLVEKHELQNFMQVDCTLALNRLISVTSPLKSLQTLALDADLSLSQVFLLVSHLVYWSKVMIIYPMCETNVYVLSPKANTLVNSALDEQFVSLFPAQSLPMELSEFSFPVQLRDTRDITDHPRQQEQKVQMVQWMLQHRLIIQLHTYIFFVPPIVHHKKKSLEDIKNNLSMPILPEEENVSGMKRGSSTSDIASVNSDESVSVGLSSVSTNIFSKSPSSEIASDSSQMSEDFRTPKTMKSTDRLSTLSKEERACIMSVPAAQNPEDLKLFSRLCPYFNGKHHVEEIMYYENLHRSQLITVLDKFREVLITTQYQDPATNLGTG